MDSDRLVRPNGQSSGEDPRFRTLDTLIIELARLLRFGMTDSGMTRRLAMLLVVVTICVCFIVWTLKVLVGWTLQ
jgi:hypothetical protein